MRVTNIEWEVDEDLEALKRLPTEVDIPNSIIPEDINNDEFIEDYAEDVRNYLLDIYGYLVSGFSLENEKSDIELD